MVILDLPKKSNLLDKMGKNGRRKAQLTFNLERFVKQYEELYLSILGFERTRPVQLG